MNVRHALVALGLTALLAGARAADPAVAAAQDPPGAAARDVVHLPARTVTIGSEVAPDEQPAHTVSLPAFDIDRREVRLEAFHHVSSGGTGAGPDHPVVGVSFEQASAYCAAQGGRLPTEEEWERACKSTTGGPYAWGEGASEHAAWWEEERYGKYGLLPGITTTPRSDPSTHTPEGVEDLTGSVWEWTSSRYHRDSYRDPGAAAASPWRVIRGGSFANLPSYATCSHREPARPDEPRLTLGFRCVYPSP